MRSALGSTHSEGLVGAGAGTHCCAAASHIQPSWMIGWLGGADIWAELAREYRRLAQEAAARGDHRRAAYIHGVLLRDLRSAANALMAGGLFRDAALIFRDKLNDDLSAARAFEQARTREARRDVELATRRWRPLVESSWTLLDEIDRDGRRFVLAVDNRPPTLPPGGALSEREHQVLTHALLGHTNKVIAYELGLSDSTVRVLLHRACRKLGVSNRAEAVARFAELAGASGARSE